MKPHYLKFYWTGCYKAVFMLVWAQLWGEGARLGGCVKPNFVSLCEPPKANVHSNTAAACVFSRLRASNYAFDLSLSTADLDRQLAEAQAATELLRAEQLFVSQKPLTDRTCLRWVASAVTVHRTDLCSHTQETHCIFLFCVEGSSLTQLIIRETL